MCLRFRGKKCNLTSKFSNKADWVLLAYRQSKLFIAVG